MALGSMIVNRMTFIFYSELKHPLNLDYNHPKGEYIEQRSWVSLSSQLRFTMSTLTNIVLMKKFKVDKLAKCACEAIQSSLWNL